MRVSTHQVQQVAINSILDQQSKLSNTQKQVATGQRIVKPSEDPVAAARLIELTQILDTTKQQRVNINSARARLSVEEGMLEGAGELLQRIRELTIQANNATQNNQTRWAIGDEIDQLLGELLGLANTTDSNNQFMFAGTLGNFRPFSRDPQGGFSYRGNDGQAMIQIGPGRQIAVSDSGTEVFRAIRNGNGTFVIQESPNNRGAGVIDPGRITGEYIPGTYLITFSRLLSDGELSYQVTDDVNGAIIIPPGMPFKEGEAIEFRGVSTFIKGEPEAGDSFVVSQSRNQDIFTTLQALVDALKTPRKEGNAHTIVGNAVNLAMVGMDQALGKFLEIRSNIGARLNALDNQENINEIHIFKLEEILSEIKDLDYAEAVSRMNLQMTGLEAAQKSYTRVQNLSLFNHL